MAKRATSNREMVPLEILLFIMIAVHLLFNTVFFWESRWHKGDCEYKHDVNSCHYIMIPDNWVEGVYFQRVPTSMEGLSFE